MKNKKVKKYSENFNRMFDFFFLLNRRGLIDFCGTSTDVTYDVNGLDCKECFRLYEDGRYKNSEIITRHPNIVKSVLIGKKGWGLWLDQWSDGIVEWCFTEEEILGEFKNRDIDIPLPMLIEFKNLIRKKKIKRNLNYLKELN